MDHRPFPRFSRVALVLFVGWMECLVCLEGLSTWWPASDDVSHYALDDDQILMASLSSQAATKHDALYRRSTGAGGVSLLGRSVLLTATRCSDRRSVVVVDPIGSRCVRLALLEDDAARYDKLVELIRRQPEMVGFVPRPLLVDNKLPPQLPPVEAMAGIFRFGCAKACASFAMKKVRNFLSAESATASTAVTLLLSGPSGSGKSHCASKLLDLIPPAYSMDTAGCRSIAAVEKRYVDVSALFEQSFASHSVADALLKILNPPLVHPSGDQDDSSKCGVHRDSSRCLPLVSVMVVHLRCIELLSKFSDRTFVHVAADTLSRIIHQWRDQHASCCRLLIVTDVEEWANLHPVLVGQDVLAQIHVPLAHPSDEMRESIIREALPHLAKDDVSYLAGCGFEKGSSHVGCILAACNKHGFVDNLMEQKRQRVEETQARGSAAAAFGSVIGLESIVGDIQRLLIAPLMHPRQLVEMGLRCPKGALLVGSTGCGKTLICACLARALHSALREGGGGEALRVDVVLVDALALIDKHVGQTEKNVHAIFAEAQTRAPCVLIIDNIDAIAPPRDRERDDSSNTADRSLSTLLVEMDGVRGSEGSPVVVVASARAKDALDPALCRPGRLDLVLSLSRPDVSSLSELLVSMLLPLLPRSAAEDLRAGVTVIVQEHFSGGNKSSSFADAASLARSVIMDTAVERGGVDNDPSLDNVLESLRHHMAEI